MRITVTLIILHGISSISSKKMQKKTSTLQDQQDIIVLLNKVNNIVIASFPGVISVYGPTAFTVIAAQNDDKIYQPVVAAGHLGKGKIVGTSHDVFFVPDNSAGDRNQFILNCISWASGSTTPRVLILTDDDDKLTNFFTDNSIKAVQKNMKFATSTSLTKFDVVVVRQFFDSIFATIIREYAQNGGGLIVTLTSWAYSFHMDVPGHFGANFPGNKVSSQAGFVWKRKGLSSPGSYSAKTSYQKHTTVLDACTEIKKILSTGSSSKSVLQYSTVLLDGFEDIPPGDPFWVGQFFKDAPNYIRDQPIPTVKNPATKDIDKLKLQIYYALNRYVLKPQDIKIHPSSTYFPGMEDTVFAKLSDENNRSSKIHKVSISFRAHGSQSINTCYGNPEARWFSTGTYAPPGALIELAVMSKENVEAYQIQIGSHADDISSHSEWYRPPKITLSKHLSNHTVNLASPYGGLIYIVIPDKVKQKNFIATIKGCVRAPYFKLGTTDINQWRSSVRSEPGPWAEFENDKIVLTVRSSIIRKLENPNDLMIYWNTVMDSILDFLAIPRESANQQRIIEDVQITLGEMHSGYPIMTTMDSGDRGIDYPYLKGQGNWGHYHELGHNFQESAWTFNGTTEVTNNVIVLFLLDTIHGIKPEKTCEELHTSSYKTKVQNYIASGLDFQTVWKNEDDPWLALMFYVQLQRVYGWNSFTKVFAKYHEMPCREQSDEQKMDLWMITFSKVVEKNLASFFKSWGIPITQDAINAIKKYPSSGISMNDLLNDK